jgi:L-ascorbate metabolism protein UlaG (beta-lactamase superfamily)
MDIFWLGHACLRLQSAGTVLVTDPFDKTVGYALSPQKADIVTVSHDHPHHSHTEAITGKPYVVHGPGEYEIGSFYLTGMPIRIGTEENDRRVNTIFSMRSEGLTVCHLGEITHPLTPRQAQELNKTDVLIVPAGGSGTLPVDRIPALVNMIEPRILIPVHYRTDGVDLELEPVDRFLQELGVTEVSPVNRLNVSLTNLPREMRVVVLQRTS